MKGCCFYSFDLFEFVNITFDTEGLSMNLIVNKIIYEKKTTNISEKTNLSNNRFIICSFVKQIIACVFTF